GNDRDDLAPLDLPLLYEFHPAFELFAAALGVGFRFVGGQSYLVGAGGQVLAVGLHGLRDVDVAERERAVLRVGVLRRVGLILRCGMAGSGLVAGGRVMLARLGGGLVGCQAAPASRG